MGILDAIGQCPVLQCLLLVLGNKSDGMRGVEPGQGHATVPVHRHVGKEVALGLGLVIMSDVAGLVRGMIAGVVDLARTKVVVASHVNPDLRDIIIIVGHLDQQEAAVAM